MVTKPLYGHVSEETAYLVPDYPYGPNLRCQKRFWIEHVSNKGFRLCTQTTNPKKGDIWNKVSKSTYSILAACMYLDEKGHVHWTALNEYSETDKFLDFFMIFPDIVLEKEQIGRLRYWVAGKKQICKVKISGKSIFKNSPPPSELDIEKAKQELEMWNKVETILLPKP